MDKETRVKCINPSRLSPTLYFSANRLFFPQTRGNASSPEPLTAPCSPLLPPLQTPPTKNVTREEPPVLKMAERVRLRRTDERHITGPDITNLGVQFSFYSLLLSFSLSLPPASCDNLAIMLRRTSGMFHDGCRASRVGSFGTVESAGVERLREAVRSRDGAIEQQTRTRASEQRGSRSHVAREQSTMRQVIKLQIVRASNLACDLIIYFFLAG